MLQEYRWDPAYALAGIEDVLTPALVLYPELIAANIERTLELLGGDANRWRVHIKTAKLEHTLRMLVERGVRNFKCATTLELLVACGSGAVDVLLAYPAMGANARRVCRKSRRSFPTCAFPCWPRTKSRCGNGAAAAWAFLSISIRG